ncbi:MAG: peptidyl-prolyl cis-trans isomerase [Candidatus Omnitrophota bacterium]
MRKGFYFFAVVLILFAVAAAGCGKKADKGEARKNEVVATVDGENITSGEIQNKMDSLPDHYKNIVRQHKREFVDDIISEKVLLKEALKRGLDKDKEVVSMINETRRRIIVSKLVKDEMEKVSNISDAEIERYYNANQDKFMLPERWRASHILVKTEDEAKAVAERLSKGESFEDLAKENSVDGSAEQGGDIGFFASGQLIPEFEEVAVKLEAGKVSGIVKSQFGYHIIKVTDHKPTELQPLDSVKQRISNELLAQKRKDAYDIFVGGLKSKSKITVNEELLMPAEEDTEDELVEVREGAVEKDQ